YLRRSFFGHRISHGLDDDFEAACHVHIVQIKITVLVLEKVSVDGIGRKGGLIYEGAERVGGDGDADLLMPFRVRCGRVIGIVEIVFSIAALVVKNIWRPRSTSGVIESAALIFPMHKIAGN